MAKTLLLCFFLCCYCGHIALYAQNEESLEQQIGKLSQKEKEKLLELIRENQLVSPDEKLKSELKNLGPKEQESIQDYILMIKGKDFVPYSAVVFSADTIDFGRIPLGKIVTDSILVEVRGEEPYIPKNFISSCPYAEVSLPEFPVMPDIPSYIKLTLNTRKLSAGPLRIAVSVRGNNLPNRRQIFYIKAEIVDERNLKYQRP